ncbi:hypothetical protein PsYK624_051050 [Phanerochaete sordida]|uniref:Uncharacterized protein n=1 Tax=Phanerochaete sordida TaxID=48140 RepID=A0A9P3G678_9APHY|nr:hypothetical protein PsYK624_051050 [Phanerochaete sordida]
MAIATGLQAVFGIIVAIAVIGMLTLFILWYALSPLCIIARPLTYLRRFRRWRAERRAASGARGRSSGRGWIRPESAVGRVLARLPAAHLHESPPYDVEHGQAYENIELQAAPGREARRLPAYDAEAKPPEYGDVPS